MPKLPEMKKRIVLSLGGSLVVPDGGIDTKFLSEFSLFIRKLVRRGFRFIIVVGGGTVARHYRDAGEEVLGHKLTAEDLDWLGIHATRLNAHLIRTIFRDISHPRIAKHYKIILKTKKPILVAAGWKPGWSTDYCATILAEDYHLSEIVNLSNIDHVYNRFARAPHFSAGGEGKARFQASTEANSKAVESLAEKTPPFQGGEAYDADPKLDKSTKPLTSISWKDYRKMVGDRWVPGMNVPFDPIASKNSQRLGLTVRVLDGRNLDNLENCLRGKEFIGTIIK